MITAQPQPWRVGEKHLRQTIQEISKLRRIISLIAEVNEEHDNLMAYSRNVGVVLPQLRSKAIREAHIRVVQSERLRKIFNMIANEIAI